MIGAKVANSLRLILASLLLLVCVYANNIPTEISYTAIFLLSASGIIGLVFGDGCFFHSLILIGPRLATLTMSSWPVLAAFLGWIVLGESISIIAGIGVIITMLSIAFVATEKHSSSTFPMSSTGFLWAFFGALFQAIGFVIAKKGMEIDTQYEQPKTHALFATCVRVCAAAVWMWVVIIIKGQAKTYYSKLQSHIIGYLVAAMFFGPFLGIWLSLIAIKNTDIAIASTLIATTPLWIIPIAAIVYKDKISLRSILGTLGATVGIALLLSNR